MNSRRLESFLGWPAIWVLNPKRSFYLCSLIWLALLPFTWQRIELTSLACLALWTLCLTVFIEAPLLQVLPLPPLTVLFLGFFLRIGLGPLLLAITGSGRDSFVNIWIQYGGKAQLLWIPLLAFLLLFSLQNKPVVLRLARTLNCKVLYECSDQSPVFTKRQKNLAVILSIYFFAYLLLSLISGAFDRQFETYSSVVNMLWRIDTPIVAFSRLRDFWFFLFPLWWRIFSLRWRMILLFLLVSFFLIVSLSGSRGLLFYPLILLLFGSWFVVDDPSSLRKPFLALCLSILVLAPIIYVARDSTSFQGSSGLADRIRSVGNVLSSPHQLVAKARWTGRDLYACHDPYLFSPANSALKPAGTSGLSALAYIWFPRHFFPQRPAIFDGHTIAKKLQHIQETEWSKVWFPCISFPGDLYRRFYVPGLIIGSFLMSLILAKLMHIWYRNVAVHQSTFRFLLLVFPATYIQSFPLSSVSETTWIFIWELPKYLISLYLLGRVVDHLSPECPIARQK